MYALAAQSAGTNWVVLIFSICSNIRWILPMFIHAPTEKEQKRIQEMIAEMEVGDLRTYNKRFLWVINYLQMMILS